MLSVQVKNLLLDPSLVIPVEAVWERESILTVDGETPCLEPWRIQGKISNVGGAVLEFEGTVDTKITMECGRCMKPVEVPLNIVIQQRFAKDQASNVETLDQDDFLLPIENDRIDLDETILHEVQLGVPMKVLCKEDCKGLCPICGQDLNEGQCDCEEDNTDPRWEALKGLFSE